MMTSKTIETKKIDDDEPVVVERWKLPRCQRCHGTGRIFAHHSTMQATCPDCGGTGLQ